MGGRPAVGDQQIPGGHGGLVEIQDPEPFYVSSLAGAHDTPAGSTGAAKESAGNAPGSTSPGVSEASEEKLLERIVELEALLDADLARKPRFQKPELQAAWRRELETLNARLDDA